MADERRAVLLVTHDTRPEARDLATTFARALQACAIDVRVCDDDMLASHGHGDWTVCPPMSAPPMELTSSSSSAAMGRSCAVPSARDMAMCHCSV